MLRILCMRQIYDCSSEQLGDYRSIGQLDTGFQLWCTFFLAKSTRVSDSLMRCGLSGGSLSLAILFWLVLFPSSPCHFLWQYPAFWFLKKGKTVHAQKGIFDVWPLFSCAYKCKLTNKSNLILDDVISILRFYTGSSFHFLIFHVP